jgi:hypothetical protein
MITLKYKLDNMYLLKQTNNNEGAIQMNKLRTLLLPSMVTLGIGASAIFGNGAIASQAMERSITPESPTTISQRNVANTLQDEKTDKTSKLDATLNENNLPPLYPEGGIPEDRSLEVVFAKSIENGDTIMVNGEEVLLKDYIKGEMWKDIKVKLKNYVEGQPGDDDISSETAIDTAKKELIQKYSLKQELIEKFKITAEYYTKYEDISVPVWRIYLYPSNINEFTEIGCYTAILDASTGKAIQLLSAADGKG